MSHIKKLNLERPSLKDYGWIVAGCLIHLVNCEGINRLFGFTEDYMYLRSDLPFEYGVHIGAVTIQFPCKPDDGTFLAM